MANKPDDIPDSRLGRGAMIGGLAARESAKYAGTAAANLARRPPQRRIKLEERQLQSADRMLAVLGTMKGPAMKLGQMLSFVDLGFLPEDVRPRFQQRLASLCEEAPAISWDRMEPTLAAALGQPVSAAFREIDPAPVGSASIGQVYRAQLHDGRDVAVKVQYPKIVSAARADLKNLAVLLRLGRSFAPSIDTDALARELSRRFLEELDYANEARNTAEMAALFAGHPHVRVAAPILELCTPTVIVTEFLDGTDFAAIANEDNAARDRFGEVVGRFYLGTLVRSGIFSGDPHPGNIKLLADGRLAFLDFGSVERLGPQQVTLVQAVLRALLERRGADAIRLLSADSVIARPDKLSGDGLMEFVHDILGWLLVDDTVELTPRSASETMIKAASPVGDYSALMRGQDFPVEWALMVRTLITTTALVGQIRASGNWYRMASEWVAGFAPETEVGVADAAFWV
ncbi:MAG TPA: AarF/ABC1/UbiB kinase family protein [Nocardioidaceae bacterium]|nr:AarF/ABC1/UbiB kinase family protein [Nocardioidaceae bacterium]